MVGHASAISINLGSEEFVGLEFVVMSFSMLLFLLLFFDRVEVIKKAVLGEHDSDSFPNVIIIQQRN